MTQERWANLDEVDLRKVSSLLYKLRWKFLRYHWREVGRCRITGDSSCRRGEVIPKDEQISLVSMLNQILASFQDAECSNLFSCWIG